MKSYAGRYIMIVFGATIAGAIFGVAARFPVALGAEDKAEPTEVRYAKAYLQLAEAQLAVARQTNQRAPGTLNVTQVDAYRDDVEVCKGLVKEATEGKGFDRIKALVQLADYRVEDARKNVQLSEAANERFPGTIDNDRLNLLRAYAALAQLNFETGQAASTASPSEQMQWRVAVLEDEVQRLRDEVSRLRSNR